MQIDKKDWITDEFYKQVIDKTENLESTQSEIPRYVLMLRRLMTGNGLKKDWIELFNKADERGWGHTYIFSKLILVYELSFNRGYGRQKKSKL